MKITYIGHSGFLVEMEQVYLLFDYYKGKIPNLNREKKLFIFVSHKHQDHYNRDIWNLKEQYEDAHVILSKDVPFSARQRGLLGISEEDCARVTRVRANDSYLLSDRTENPIQINTLKSTDLGVAYLVTCENHKIYHAGDLNRWVWRGESDSWNQNMAKNYSIQIDILQKQLGNGYIDIAFLPLDFRQEDDAFNGINEFFEKIQVKTVLPMHLWGKYDLIKQYQQSVPKEWADKVVRIEKMGQEFLFA